jgi:hypothetical protein
MPAGAGAFAPAPALSRGKKARGERLLPVNQLQGAASGEPEMEKIDHERIKF